MVMLTVALHRLVFRSISPILYLWQGGIRYFILSTVPFQIKTRAASNSAEYSSFSLIFFSLFDMGLLICANGRRDSEKSA